MSSFAASAGAAPDTAFGTAVPAAILPGETVTGLIASVVQLERMIAQLHGIRSEVIEQARALSELIAEPRIERAPMARRAFVSELACAMHVSDRVAESVIGQSQAIVQFLPRTRAALLAGELTWRQAQSMVDHTSPLTDEQRAAVEAATVHHGSRMTAAEFDRRVRTTRERLAPEAMTERVERAVTRRTVDLSSERDGMAWVSALLPAADAHAIYARLTGAAKSFQNDGDGRTLPQLRADILRSCLLDDDALDLAGEVVFGGSGESRRYRGIRPQILVTVPVMTLLGHANDPATMEGYGPIDPQTARELTAEAPSLARVLTDPDTAAVLSVGRDRYRIPAELRLWLRIRDGHCRFPGCGRSPAYCEIDHTVDWQHGGRTDHGNLANLCSSHHTMKQSSGWTVVHGENGELIWTSPFGFQYTTHPELDLAT